MCCDLRGAAAARHQTRSVRVCTVSVCAVTCEEQLQLVTRRGQLASLCVGCTSTMYSDSWVVGKESSGEQAGQLTVLKGPAVFVIYVGKTRRKPVMYE